jgi:nifR3 family TIM-barrel protein
MTSLTDGWNLGPLRVHNRVVLAPLAGIGNWFVRLQATRHGAGMAVSEMVSSHAIHYGNERTCSQLLRIDPDELAARPDGKRAIVAVQLFGHDPEIMRSAARQVASTGAQAIDINMGCPVPKVCRTGAGAALLRDPDRALALARAAIAGSGLPVTVKLRSGVHPADDSGFSLAHRLVDEAGVAAVAFHPRPISAQHRGRPDYELAARLASSLQAPMILSGGLLDAVRARDAFQVTGATAIMLARGSLGNPWLFERLLERRGAEPTAEEVLRELAWVSDRACEHLGSERATRYLRKFYPWYIPRLGLERRALPGLQAALQLAPTRERAGELLELALLEGSGPGALLAALR